MSTIEGAGSSWPLDRGWSSPRGQRALPGLRGVGLGSAAVRVAPPSPTHRRVATDRPKAPAM